MLTNRYARSMTDTRIVEKRTVGMMGVYQIKNKETGAIYVGSSKAIQQRWRLHLLGAKNGIHDVPAFVREWQKYGAAAFEFSILELVESEDRLDAREEYWIKKLNATGIMNSKKIRSPRTHISIHTTTMDKLNALGKRSVNEAIVHLLNQLT